MIYQHSNRERQQEVARGIDARVRVQRKAVPDKGHVDGLGT